MGDFLLCLLTRVGGGSQVLEPGVEGCAGVGQEEGGRSDPGRGNGLSQVETSGKRLELREKNG